MTEGSTLPDKKSALLDVLDSVFTCYLKLTLLKDHEQEAYDQGNCETLYELSVSERVVVDEINDLMKYAVPDLVYMKRDPDISRKLQEIDRLQEQVVKRSIELRKNLADRISLAEKKLAGIKRMPGNPYSSIPAVVNLRA
jgi:hypothetical protein